MQKYKIEDKDGKIDLVNYLKGYSITTIVLMHLILYLNMNNIVNKISSFGGAGVHIFILCSGFGLYYSYLKKPISFKIFLKKRFLKIYFPYIIVILISSIFSFMYIYKDKFMAILSHVFLFKMFNQRYETSFGIQFWFISTIIQFYLIFYLLIKLKESVNNKNFLLLSLCISFLWWVTVWLLDKSDIRIWNSFVFQYLWEFSLGMILAEMIYYKKQLSIPNNYILAILSLVGLGITGICSVIGGPLKLFNDVTSMVGYGSLALLIYNLNINFINKMFIKLNKISYELFLTHILIFSIIFHISNIYINKYILAVLALMLSIIIAIVFKVIINRLNLN